MKARKIPEGEALPDPDDVLRVMLQTPPRPHSGAPPEKSKRRPTPASKKKAAK